MLDTLNGSHLRSLLDCISAPVFIADAHSGDRFVYACANSQLEGVLGLQTADYAGRTVNEMFPEEQAERIRSRYAKCMSSRCPVEFEEFVRFPKSEGWWRTTLRPVLDACGRVVRIFGTASDITEQKQAQEMLRYQHMLLSVQQDLTPDGILVSDDAGNYLSWNRQFLQSWGLSEEQMRQGREAVLPQVLAQLVDPQAFLERLKGLYLDLHAILDAEELELKDGRTLAWYSRGLSGEGDVKRGRVWYVRDISERKSYERQLRELATTDGLTGLWNRRHFQDVAVQVVERARREQEPLAVLLLDVDHFKRINDTHGHGAGDAVLQAAASIFPKCLRSSDLWCRWGGEEFAIALVNTSAEGALLVAERVRAAIEVLEVSYADQVLRITASLGMASWQPQEATLCQALQRADQALYQAKEAGRNCACTAELNVIDAEEGSSRSA